MTENNKTDNKTPYILFGTALVAVVGVTSWWVFNSNQPQPVTPIVTETQSEPVTGLIPSEIAEPEDSVEEPIEEPIQDTTETVTEVVPPKPEPVALNESDEPFRTEVANLAPAHPVIDWLTPNQIIRKLAAMVDGASRGELLFKNRPVERGVEGSFIIDDSSGEIVLSADNYARYDTVISAFEYIDITTAVSLYEFWSPRLEQAYSELGVGGSFHDALMKSIDNLLAAPSVEGRVRLVRPAVYYKFADPELESRSDLEKFIIRIGPANAERLKNKLTRLRDALANG
ncbi:MAG: DUF3014 domain-containing protein [Gammaproteobacteria bacterium]|nr:DUF3014 domain-containing protein [Gammaproteobacteria bacterium]